VAETVSHPWVSGLLDNVIGAQALSFEVPGSQLAGLVARDRGSRSLAEDPCECGCDALEVTRILPGEFLADGTRAEISVLDCISLRRSRTLDSLAQDVGYLRR
jgi:hypothetical protein